MATPKAITPIIIRKIKPPRAETHNASTWKIALADFMTAMFIIFLLLWLVNQTSPDIRHGLAQYFAPRSLSSAPGGVDGVGRGQGLSDGVAIAPASPLGIPNGGGRSSPQQGEGATEMNGHPGALDHPTARLVEPGVQAPAIERRIRQALQETPELRGFEQNLQVEPTKAGVRIQLIDTQRQALFPSGEARATPAVQALMRSVAAVIADLPNAVEISGHTDAAPLPRRDYSNWELSSDRAHLARRLLRDYGVEEARFAGVVGLADRAPLDPAQPLAPHNRRVSILLLTTTPQDAQATNAAAPRVGPAPTGRLITR